MGHASTPVQGNKQVKFKYGYMGRRVEKAVYAWYPSNVRPTGMNPRPAFEWCVERRTLRGCILLDRHCRSFAYYWYNLAGNRWAKCGR